MAMEFLWDFCNQNSFWLGLNGYLGPKCGYLGHYVSRYSIWDGTDERTNEGGYRSPSAGTSGLKISEFFKKSDDSGILLQF